MADLAASLNRPLLKSVNCYFFGVIQNNYSETNNDGDQRLKIAVETPKIVQPNQLCIICSNLKFWFLKVCIQLPLFHFE